MSFMQQLLVSLFLVSCATSPNHSPSDESILDQLPPEESIMLDHVLEPLNPREQLIRAFSGVEYANIIARGEIFELRLPLPHQRTRTIYQLRADNFLLWLYPDTGQMLAVNLDQNLDNHQVVLRQFFRQNQPLFTHLGEVRAFVGLLERWVYQGDILENVAEALRLFDDPDRFLATKNPFFAIIFDGRYYELDYITLQNNRLWQKRIRLSIFGEIIEWEQEMLSLERRGVI